MELALLTVSPRKGSLASQLLLGEAGDKLFKFRILLPNGCTTAISIHAPPDEMEVVEFISLVRQEYNEQGGRRQFDEVRPIKWDGLIYLEDLFQRKIRNVIFFKQFKPNKLHLLRLQDECNAAAHTLENMWDLTPDTDLLAELPAQYTLEASLANLIDNSLQALRPNCIGRRRLISINVDDTSVSILMTGPSVDGSEENSIVKWEKMASSSQRAAKKSAVGGKPLYLKLNGYDLVEVDGGEMATSSLHSCDGPDFVFQVCFSRDQEATTSDGMLSSANARLKCIYFPFIKGKDSVDKILEKLKTEGWEGLIPFMEPKFRKGDKIQALKRCSDVRVECFIDTDAEFSPSPPKIDLASHDSLTTALKHLGNKLNKSDVSITVTKNGNKMSMLQFEKEYMDWVLSMHEKYGEEIFSGEDQPVIVVNPDNAKKLGISSDVVRVHKVVTRKGQYWKSGQRIRISKDVEGVQKNNIYATSEYIVLEGFEGDSRDSRLICRPLGCLLDEGGHQTSLDIRDSLSFPVSVIDLGKCEKVENRIWNSHIGRHSQKSASKFHIKLDVGQGFPVDDTGYENQLPLEDVSEVCSTPMGDTTMGSLNRFAFSLSPCRRSLEMKDFSSEYRKVGIHGRSMISLPFTRSFQYHRSRNFSSNGPSEQMTSALVSYKAQPQFTNTMRILVVNVPTISIFALTLSGLMYWKKYHDAKVKEETKQIAKKNEAEQRQRERMESFDKLDQMLEEKFGRLRGELEDVKTNMIKVNKNVEDVKQGGSKLFDSCQQFYGTFLEKINAMENMQRSIFARLLNGSEGKDQKNGGKK